MVEIYEYNYCGNCQNHITHDGDCDRYGATQPVELIDDAFAPVGGGCDSFERFNTLLNFHKTDLGNAKRLTSIYGADCRYCHQWKQWIIWNEKNWKKDGNGEIFRRAKKVITLMYAELADIDDDKERKKAYSFISGCEAQNKLKNMVESASNEPGIPINTEELDKNPALLNVANGTIDLRNGDIKPHNKTDYLTQIIDIEYNPAANCKQFLHFLDVIFEGNTEIIDFIQAFAGYCLTGETKEEILVIFHGVGSNGKTTLVEILMMIMCEYAQTINPEVLMEKKYDNSPTNDLAAIKESRLITTSETKIGRALDEGKIKRMTGRDRIKCRFLYQEEFEYMPQYKVILSTNHEPQIKGADHGIWRRIVFVPFNIIIAPADQDKDLRLKLEKEKEGILQWMVEGALKYYMNGLEVPDVVRKATEDYQADMDVIGDFVFACCDRIRGDYVRSGILFKVYKLWCATEGIKAYSQKMFSLALKDRSLKKDRKGSGIIWKDITLKTEIFELLNEMSLHENEKLAWNVGMQGFARFLETSLSRGLAPTSYTKNASTIHNEDTAIDSSLHSTLHNHTQPYTEAVDIEKTQKKPKIKNISDETEVIIFEKCGMCGIEHPIENLEDAPHSKGIQKICHSCQVELINDFNKKNFIPSQDNNGIIKIKLKIPRSEFTINGKKYDLKKGDIADIPKVKAEALIRHDMAVEVDQGAGHNVCNINYSQRDRYKNIRNIIRQLQRGNGNTAGYSEIIEAAKVQGINDTEAIIKKLKRDGSIHEVKTGLYQVV